MHQLIRIVSAGSHELEAHDRAFAYADELVEQGMFDWYNDGEERWEEGGKTYQLTSALGKQAVESALASNRAAFDRAMHAVRLMLRDFTDEQIYQEDFGSQEETQQREYFASRWQFSQVGGRFSYLHADSEVWGGSIANEREYARATEGRDDLWVTNIDLHS